MQSIFAPIIAITLVLLAVFVPVGFISGISGELFRQFAVTVAVAMFLSAINALTLSPALCAVLLKPQHGPKRGIIGVMMRSIDRVRDLYGSIVARLVQISIIGVVVVVAAFGGVGLLSKVTPTGFLPPDDQGAFFVVVQLPDGASIGRTSDVVRQVETILQKESAIADVSSIIGLNFIDNYSQPNAGFVVVTLKGFDERKGQGDSADAIIGALPASSASCGVEQRFPCSRHPIIGLGSGGGFAFVVQDIQGGPPQNLAQVTRGLVIAANQDPQLSRVFSTYSATNPSIYLEIDRDKARIIWHDHQLHISGATDIARRFLCQRHEMFRPDMAGPGAGRSRRPSFSRRYLRINVRSAEGKMVPLRSLVEVRVALGPQGLVRYDNTRAATVQGGPAPGVSSGRSLAAMDQVAARTRRAAAAAPGPIFHSRRNAPRARRRSSWLSQCCSPILFLVGLYES